MTVENLPNVIFLTDDDAIKAMILRAGIPMARPEPPNDMAIANFTDGDVFWVAVRFYLVGDEGYMAVGIPLSEPDHAREAVVRLLLQHFTDMAAAKGHDAWEAATCRGVAPPEAN